MESLGARLKRERQQRKITLDEISLSTKIGTRFLLAIEEEHFDQLPGGIFNKGFIRAYARSIGIDEAQAVADYELASGASLPENQPEASPVLAVPAAPPPAILPEESINGASRIPWGWFAVALLVVAFGFALWGFHSREKSAQPSLIPPPAAAAGNSSVPAPSLTPGPLAAKTGVGQSMAPAPAAPADVPPQQASPAPAVGLPDATAASTPDAALSPGAFLVQIKARADSWVAIIADGRQIMQETLNASAEKSIGARDLIVIKTGNAGALDISFNGKKLPTQGAYNEVKTLTFDPNGLKL